MYIQEPSQIVLSYSILYLVIEMCEILFVHFEWVIFFPFSALYSYLQGNYLSGLIPSELGRLQELTNLWVFFLLVFYVICAFRKVFINMEMHSIRKFM